MASCVCICELLGLILCTAKTNWLMTDKVILVQELQIFGYQAIGNTGTVFQYLLAQLCGDMH